MSNDNAKRKRFIYNFSKEKQTVVEFEIGFSECKKVARNITLISNWRNHYPENPPITQGPKGENGFYNNGVWMTNGDIQQMILRIERILAEDRD